MRCTWPMLKLRGNQFIHDRRIGLLQIIEQHLHILARENFVAMPADGFRKMRDQHRRRVHDRVTGRFPRSCVPRR